MSRLPAPLLAVLLAVTPTLDAVCRAVCTPVTTAADVPSCHEVDGATTDGVLVPVACCHSDAVTAVLPTDVTRNLVARAPLVTAQISSFGYMPASAGADIRRQAVRPRLSHSYPSTIVLRI